jgi:AmmeMemoRadiSam system protein B
VVGRFSNVISIGSSAMRHPKLRPGLTAALDGDPRFIFLVDQLRITGQPLRLTRTEFEWLRLFNGRRSPRDVQAEAMRQAGGLLVPVGPIEELIGRLDAALFLDNDHFDDYLTGPDREPSCLGCYPADVGKLRRLLGSLFAAPGGPGQPGEPGCRVEVDGHVRAILVPHVDYGRGGVTYGWGFKELVERTDASLFVIIATSHYSPERFTLTRKNFKTPFGKVETDQGYIDRLEKHYGNGLFNDPIAHLPEHSIELEVVLLQYLLDGKRPFRIVPLVVGSFGDCVERGRAPREADDIGRMIGALRHAEAECGEAVAYLISGDLAHIGPKFEDPESVAEPLLGESLARDQSLLAHAERADMRGYFDVIVDEGDRRRICGLPPTYVTVEATQPARGRLLHYGRYVHPRGDESVSFASMAFDV